MFIEKFDFPLRTPLSNLINCSIQTHSRLKITFTSIELPVTQKGIPLDMACNMSRMNLSNTACDSWGVWEWENFLFNISPRALRRQTLKICWRWLWYALSAELEFCIQKYFAFNLPTNFTLKFFISVRQSNKSITPECLGIPRHDDFLERHKKSKVVFAVEEEKKCFHEKSFVANWMRRLTSRRTSSHQPIHHNHRARSAAEGQRRSHLNRPKKQPVRNIWFDRLRRGPTLQWP